jgi:hypothetical protein
MHDSIDVLWRNGTMNKSQFFEEGWCRFKFDKKLMHWVNHALSAARESVSAGQNRQWLRCGGTWFAGVNALPNTADAALNGGDALAGNVIDFIHNSLGLKDIHWDQAQVSVCYPAYPQPMPGETEAAFAYRRDRDAAHVDGLLPEGINRRRHLREFHGFILGIPMVEFGIGASPFVIWEGSHEIVRESFIAKFRDLPPQQWGNIDVTEVYHETRRRIFDCCKRIEIYATPGEAYLVHRLALHGIAPWKKDASATEDGRMICYFRPEIGSAEEWLFNP